MPCFPQRLKNFIGGDLRNFGVGAVVLIPGETPSPKLLESSESSESSELLESSESSEFVLFFPLGRSDGFISTLRDLTVLDLSIELPSIMTLRPIHPIKPKKLLFLA